MAEKQEVQVDNNSDFSMDRDDDNFKPLSQMTKEELAAEKGETVDSTKDKKVDTTEPVKEVITFSEEVLEEIEGLEGNDLDTEANSIIETDKSFDDLTERERAILDKAGYDLSEVQGGEGDDSDSDVKSVFLEAATSLELEVEDEEAFKSLDVNNPEDIVKFAQNVAEVKAEEMLSGVLQKSGLLENVYKLVANGADDKTIMDSIIKESSTSAIELTDESTSDDKASIMKQLLVSKGIKESMADVIIDAAIEKATLDTDVKELYNEYKESTKSVLEAKAKEQEQARIAQEQAQSQQIEKYWTDVDKTISTGNLNGVKVPKSEMESFKKWLSVPVDKKSNQSKSIIDYTQLPLESKLAFDYIRYKIGDKKVDLSKLFDNVTRTKSVRELLRQQEDTSSGGKQNSKKVVYGGVSNLRGSKQPII